jgi:hypothetical protein
MSFALLTTSAPQLWGFESVQVSAPLGRYRDPGLVHSRDATACITMPRERLTLGG